MSTQVETRMRLDRDGRREAILDAAAEVFMEQGFAASSMNEIAARVGGSKGTLYNYFKNKEELFAAYIARYCAFQQRAMDDLLASSGDLREVLDAVGRTYLDVSVSPFSLRNLVLVISEAWRAPEIGQAFYEAGPRRGAEKLAAFMAQASADGRLKPCDPEIAAMQFIALCQNRLLKACLTNSRPSPNPDEIAREVAAAVDTFLAAFGP
ncbi:MAG: TetR/AcrR family transcriptional regulator [Alphaproteobacteria bacterium]|jgi:AcrR family transcriptional regulator|nr:TetR/AcrR family transcriptional regulator [Alphaproteobacteria bacterium]